MARPLDPNKRATILEAARSIFRRDGYDSAKMSDIADEAGVAPGTLYLYFKSKEALASVIGEDFFNRLSSQFRQVIKKIDGPEGVDALLNWALRIAVQERDVLMMARDCKPDTKSRPEGRQQFVGQLAEVLKGLMSRGVIRPYKDADYLADVVLAVMHRVVMSYAIFEDSDAEEIKATAATLLKHALFADSSLVIRSPAVKPATTRR